MSTYLDILLGAQVQENGVKQTPRRYFNFGTGFSAADDPANDRINLTVTGVGAPRSADTYDELEALAVAGDSLSDGVLYTVKNDPTRGPWLWSTSGAGENGDRKTSVKLTETFIGDSGRFYNTQGAAILPTRAAFLAATQGVHDSIELQGRYAAGDVPTRCRK